MTKFSCDCGSQLEAEEVEVHFSTCEKVGEKYGLVFQALKALVNKGRVEPAAGNACSREAGCGLGKGGRRTL